MSTDPYKVSPGDLITASLFNGLQNKVKEDTAGQITEAIKGITKVAQAGDAEKLGGKSPAELEKKLIDRALEEIQRRSGYAMIFKRLEVNKPKVVNHDLKTFPLVDAYQLDYFEVVCADGDEKEDKFVNFYLYHSDEGEQKRVGDPKKKITIESSKDDEFVFKIRFDRMLDRLGIKYTPSQSIADVVTEFWETLFKRPNDRFDPDQYCNSPWFEKCCGDNRAMSTLQGRDNLDQLFFKMMARKTINFPAPPATAATESQALYPNNLEVVHLDFENIGVRLLAKPFYDKTLIANDANNDTQINQDELKVMLLLKV